MLGDCAELRERFVGVLPDLLRALLFGRTSVVVAHRLRSAERADRVVMVDAGEIIAEGTHDQLAEDSAPYRELVEVWQRGLA